MPCRSRRCSAISARPVRTADPRRSILSEEGGVGTVSSRVRRARSSRGTRVGGAVAVFGGEEAFRPVFFAVFFFGADALRTGGRLRLARFTARRLGARFGPRRAGAARRAGFRDFAGLRFAIGFYPFEP